MWCLSGEDIVDTRLPRIPDDAKKERKKENGQPKGGMGGRKKEIKKTYNPREGWEDGTPPPHRDFKERGVVR